MKYLIAFCALAVFAMAGAVAFRGKATTSSASIYSSGAKISTISHGEAVDLEEHVAGQGYVVVSFCADW